MTLAELTPEWAQKVLTATTRSHEQGRRQTYIYLHDLLYPLYAQLPAFLDDEQRHQFLVFADDNTLNKLVRWMNALAESWSTRRVRSPLPWSMARTNSRARCWNAPDKWLAPTGLNSTISDACV